MRKVLMVAHQFPPVGGSGVQRTTKFVKYLRLFGWEPVVFTRDIKGMPLKDESLLSDIPDGVKIVRTRPWNFAELPGVLSLPGKFINRRVLIPDGERLWQLFGRKKAAETAAREGVDLIYTTSYPYSDHLMGLYLKKRFPRIPWVADFRDEWTKNPNILDYNYNRLRMSIERDMEAKVLETADFVIANTPVMMENFLEGREHLKDKFTVIPNGYDEEDFIGLNDSPPHNSRFTVTYTGLLYGRRCPDTFMKALSQLIQDGLVDRSKVLLRLIGSFKSGYIEGLTKKYMLDGVVEKLPYMKHRDSIQHLLNSDALLLLAGTGEEAFYLGKIFEYMRTGRPILAVVPEKGAASRLVRESATGCVSDSTDVSGTAENILKLYSDWLQGKNSLSPNRKLIESFERKVLTENLAKVFEKAMETALHK